MVDHLRRARGCSEARLASGRRVSSVQVVPLDVALFGDEPLAVHSPKPARVSQPASHHPTSRQPATNR